MIPILYSPTEKNFTSNGICRLVDTIRCIVTEQRNGIYELELDYPTNGRNYDKITEGCIIYTTHDDSKTPQPFDIYKSSVNIDGIVTFYASHISYRLNKMVLSPYIALTCAQALEMMPSHTVGVSNPFSFWTDKVVTSASPFEIRYPRAIRDVLGGSEGSILDIFGTGEYEFDKWSVKFHTRRGLDKDISIRYSKNMTDLNDETDVGGTNNGVAPYWVGGESGNDVVMLPEYWISSGGWQLYNEPWTTDTDDTIYNEAGNELNWIYSPNEIIPLDLSADFMETPTQAQLRAKAVSKFNSSQSWLGTRTINVDFVKLADTQEYANVLPLQNVLLCDTILIEYNGVKVRAKVVKTEYNSLLEQYSMLELGDAKLTFGTIIKQGAVTEATAGLAQIVNSSVQQMADVISGANGGHVMIVYQNGHPSEIVIMDTPDIDTATQVWRWNKDGLMHSSSGYAGPYTDLAITQDGRINASAIKTGTMTADRVRAGTLTSVDGTTYWSLDTGIIRNSNLSNTSYVEISNSKLSFHTNNIELGSFNYTYTDRFSNRYYGISLIGKKDFTAMGYSDGTSNHLVLVINNGIHSNIPEKIIIEGSTAILEPTVWYSVDDNWNVSELMRLELTDKYTSAYLSRMDVPLLHLSYLSGLTIDYTNSSGTNTWLVKVDAGYHRHAGGVFINRLFVGMDEPMADRAYKTFSVGADAYFYNNIYTDSNVYAQYFINSSDIRKKDIDEWDPRYLELLDRIDPILFHWKKGDDDQHIGYSAQDVRKAMGDLGIDGIVSESDGWLVLNYTEIFVLLQAKVKQQQKRIDELEQRLEKAERMIEKLCESLISHF